MPDIWLCALNLVWGLFLATALLSAPSLILCSAHLLVLYCAPFLVLYCARFLVQVGYSKSTATALLSALLGLIVLSPSVASRQATGCNGPVARADQLIIGNPIPPGIPWPPCTHRLPPVKAPLHSLACPSEWLLALPGSLALTGPLALTDLPP